MCHFVTILYAHQGLKSYTSQPAIEVYIGFTNYTSAQYYSDHGSKYIVQHAYMQVGVGMMCIAFIVLIVGWLYASVCLSLS